MTIQDQRIFQDIDSIAKIIAGVKMSNWIDILTTINFW